MANRTFHKIILLASIFWVTSCNHDIRQVESHFPNGKLEYSFSLDSDGNVHGVSKDYYETGILKSSISYLHGVQHGLMIEQHENGNIFCKAIYENGKLIDIREYSDENGKTLPIGSFSHGNGFLLVFDRSGSLVERGEMVDGYPHGKWEWLSNGRVIKEVNYVHGLRDDGEEKETIHW